MKIIQLLPSQVIYSEEYRAYKVSFGYNSLKFESSDGYVYDFFPYDSISIYYDTTNLKVKNPDNRFVFRNINNKIKRIKIRELFGFEDFHKLIVEAIFTEQGKSDEERKEIIYNLTKTIEVQAKHVVEEEIAYLYLELVEFNKNNIINIYLEKNDYAGLQKFLFD